MKQLTLIVHEDIEQALSDTLRGMKQVTGFTFAHVEGHGPQDERDPLLSARDLVVGYVPHVRVDILLRGEDLDAVLNALRQSTSGVSGRARYWVVEVEREGRL